MTKTEEWALKYPEWNDWHWQMRNRVRNAEELSKWIPVSPEEKKEIDACLVRFRMAVTPYYLSLIDVSDPDDPVRRESIPSFRELADNTDDREDPLNETGDSPVPFITHRYPDRVLFLVTLECAEYCRHCTRRRIVGEEDHAIQGEALDRAIGYIRDHEEVRDVLISGGDPLTLSTERLEEIVRRLREIPHVDIIRIGTRVPVVLPMRIDEGLLSMLKKYQPIWINTHFNHVQELTPESEAACGRIADAGIPLGNQSVLLRGINDTPEKMKALLLRLIHARIRPYYLYQCDLTRGIGHFRTPVQTGIDIIHALQGNITGFAIPKFVIDAPGGGGKVPFSYQYMISHDEHEIVFENYQGRIFRYPEPRVPYDTEDRSDT
ncbi:MAG: KamA family radical SAM protein [Lachnospiraceae bacterium]|nr:KamA family radical SAM protein [Lachnospiraceae bacterium]